jgi:uncharacterized BrkB/YihY/UPF0761 family membrane protein
MGHDIAAAVAAASFWIFVAVVAMAGMASAAFRHHDTQKTIRQAIEKGQTLDPETLDRLVQSGRPPKPSRAGLMFGGIMMLAIAGGLALMGVLGASANPASLSQGLGVASIVGMIGVGLLLAYFVLPRGPGQE